VASFSMAASAILDALWLGHVFKRLYDNGRRDASPAEIHKQHVQGEHSGLAGTGTTGSERRGAGVRIQLVMDAGI
jgi:hypothetical protein